MAEKVDMGFARIEVKVARNKALNATVVVSVFLLLSVFTRLFFLVWMLQSEYCSA